MKGSGATPTPAVLIWAREKGGMSVGLASQKVGVKDEQLMEWEAGIARPSIPQLRKLATVYRRPLAVFYLSEPPVRFEVMHDFRRLSRSELQNSPKLAYEVRRAFDRREWALELMESVGESPVAFNLTANIEENVESVATRFRESLAVTVEKQSQWRHEYEAFKNWRNLLEHAGILTLQATGI